MFKVITVTNNREATYPLIRSLDKFGWSYDVIETEWKGFGTKLIEVYNHIKKFPEIDRFIFCDAFDVLALGTPEEFDENLLDKYDMLTSAERGLWPPILEPFKPQYHQWEHGFNYPNSGLYYAKSAYFIWLFEKYAPFYEIDDQYWMNMCYLLEHDVHCDYEQEFFNSHSHMKEGDYGYENNRLQILDNKPLFVHFNGRTIDEKFNERIKI